MNKEGYLPKEQRKRILLLADDINLFSGVATMCREIVYGTAHHYNWIQVGSAINHPHQGQKIDLSQKVNEKMGLVDSDVVVLPWNGYGDANLLRNLLKHEKIDAIFLQTDPRYFEWLFAIENEVRKQCPIIYYTIWDSSPICLYNKKFYESCDALLAISKQTKNIVELVLEDKAKDKVIKYIPHGINENDFYPIEDQELIRETKKHYFGGKEPKFVALFNSRNIRRKAIPDLLAAWKLFTDKLKLEDQKDTALLLHTDPIDQNGTDLFAVREALFGKESNVYFTNTKLDTPKMNLLYNIANVTILPSSAEGWGLSLTESMMAGTMIIGNVTGGIQDQMRFEYKDGKWINFDKDFLSNHFGKYKKCGEWARPVFPRSMSIVGSVQTPYIYDDRLDFRDLAEAIGEVYDLGSKTQNELGYKGREWVLSDESMMSASNMCKNMIEGIDETLSKWKPKKPFELVKALKEEQKLNHPLVY
jgi:glycosyltransferase involved in cell wall biosynthesis